MKRILPALAVALAFAACSGRPSSHAAATTVLPATAPPTTTAAIDPSAIPPVITVAYLNAVLAELDHVRGGAFRAVVSSEQVPTSVTDGMRAVYADPLFSEELKIVSSELYTELGNKWADVRQPPGDRRTTVVRILSTSPSCLFVETKTDLSQVVVRPKPAAMSQYMALTAKIPGHDPHGLNATRWEISTDATYATFAPPPADPCASQ